MSDTEATTLLHEQREGHLLILTLDGPATRNAVGPEVFPRLQRAVINAADDPEVRAIVLTGAGGFFSSGGNVRRLQGSAQGTMADATTRTDLLNGAIRAIVNSAKPVIAAVEGGAAGAGVPLALACDMIVASESASFMLAYARVGLTPDGGASWFLRQALPRQLVTEILLMGQPVSARRFADFGLVNLLTLEGTALEEARLFAGRLAAGPAGATAVIRGQIASAAHNSLDAQLELEAAAINRARFGTEAREGLSAFLEKRRADFISAGVSPAADI